MKRLILKGVIQLCISSTLVLLVSFFWLKGGSMGEIIMDFFIKVPFACVAGIILSDLDVYVLRRISFMGVIASFILCVGGIYVSLYLMDVLEGFIRTVACLFVIAAPATIAYDLVSWARRKRRHILTGK